MKKLKRELKITDDGSHTFYMPDLDEHYHSTFGAVQESMHVFINAGFLFSEKNPIHILEVGFGTGLNCFLSLLEASKTGRQVVYHAIELYPLEKEFVDNLNYADYGGERRALFEKIHESPWNKDVRITNNFTLRKVEADLRCYQFAHSYDLIYFDAFAPDVQPDLWTPEIFESIYRCSSSQAILTTYCTKGIVKRALRASGFTVKRLPGPPGKREMLRAHRIDNFESVNIKDESVK